MRARQSILRPDLKNATIHVDKTALVRCGGLVVHMNTLIDILATARSGKLGDRIHAHNTAGPYTRPFVTPADPATARQVRIRNRLRSVVEAWSDTLTAAQRQGWANYATRVTVRVEPNGRRRLNGHQMFLRCNAGRTRAFMGIIADAPISGSIGTFNARKFNRLAGPGLITVPIDLDESWRSEDGAFLINYTSAGQTSGTNFFAGPFRFLGAIAGNSVTPAIGQAFSDPFGPIPAGPNSFGRQRLARADARLSDSRILPFTST